MAESIMLEKAKDFAVNIVNLCKHIYYVTAQSPDPLPKPQFLRKAVGLKHGTKSWRIEEITPAFLHAPLLARMSVLLLIPVMVVIWR